MILDGFFEKMGNTTIDNAERGLFHRIRTKLPWLLLILFGIGCGDGRPTRFPVSGQVLIDGEPLTYGYIRFVSTGARPAGGYLDEQGKFTLSCYEKNDGIIPGMYQVEVDSSEGISSTKIKWHAPKKYCNYTRSGITQEITEPTDALEINLTWDGGKPFIERMK